MQAVHAKSLAEASKYSSSSKPILVDGKKLMPVRSIDVSCCEIDFPSSILTELIATKCRSLFIKGPCTLGPSLNVYKKEKK